MKARNSDGRLRELTRAKLTRPVDCGHQKSSSESAIKSEVAELKLSAISVLHVSVCFCIAVYSRMVDRVVTAASVSVLLYLSRVSVYVVRLRHGLHTVMPLGRKFVLMLLAKCTGMAWLSVPEWPG